MNLKRSKTISKKRVGRYISLLLCLSVVMSLFVSLNVWAATSVPVVTNGASTTYLDKGKTTVTGSINVFITPEANTSYYYVFTGSTPVVDVFYTGQTDNPVGSYFEGSLVKDSLVTVLGANPSKLLGTLVGANNRITVPAPALNSPVELKIIAYKDDVASEVYTHTFKLKLYDFTSVLTNGKFTSTVVSKSDKDSSGKMYIAIYKGNKMVKTESYEFTLPAAGTVSHEFTIDANNYPSSEGYTYKALCWDDNIAPLDKAVAY